MTEETPKRHSGWVFADVAFFSSGSLSSLFGSGLRKGGYYSSSSSMIKIIINNFFLSKNHCDSAFTINK